MNRGLAVDWTFVPSFGLTRPAGTLLLYDQIRVPEKVERDQADPATIAERLGERLAFFWMLSIPAAKAWKRRDGVRFHQILELMCGSQRDIEFLLRGEEPGYTRHSLAPFSTTAREQKISLERICREVDQLSDQLAQAGVASPDVPMKLLNRWLEL